MNVTSRPLIMQRWNQVQMELLPELSAEVGVMTPKLEKLIHILDWVRIEEYTEVPGKGPGRREHDRGALSNAYVAKAVLGLKQTAALIERLTINRALRRICGFSLWKKLPSESTFSRAFAEFADSRLAERVHEALVVTHLGDRLIGHISRDGTAIEARERPKPKRAAKPIERAAPGCGEAPAASADKPRRGRPKQGEVRAPKRSRIERQRQQTLPDMLNDLPKDCDRGSKCNAQGYQNAWNGYKLHIDTADCGIPVSALLTSASLHDSQAAIPLATLTAERVTNCYDLMDAAYCSEHLRAHSRSLGHVPLIDHNPRGGEKIAFAPHEAQRYRERSQAERSNARLKDEFGGNDIWVRGHTKVMSHLMFGLLVLTADQLMRLLL